MDIESSLLGPEIRAIVGSKSNNTGVITHEVILHTEENDIYIDRLNTIEVLSDYNNNISDEINVTMLVPMGDLVKIIYPNKNNVEITIIRIIAEERVPSRYKLLLNNVDSSFTSGAYVNKTQKELNDEEMFELKGQCIDTKVEALRVMITSGIYRDTNLRKVLISTFTNDVRPHKVLGKPITFVFEITTLDNDRVYDHVIIPSGTKIIDIPSFLQETDYGIYNGDIGLYFTTFKEKYTIFIYPLYRTNVADELNRKLILYGTPNMKYEMVEETYLLTERDVKVIVSDSSKKVDEGDNIFGNLGNGFVMYDVNSVMNRPIEINDKESTATYKNNNAEMYAFDRADGVLYRSIKESTDNIYNVRSQYLKHEGTFLQLKWNFSNVTHIYPGMAVIYAYLDDDNAVKRVSGVLQSLYTLYNNSSKMASTLLNVYLEKDEKHVRK